MIIASGLEKQIVKEGTGAQPQRGQPVRVHYTGWLYDKKTGTRGNKFDSSVDRGQPFVFVVGMGQVIRGWDLGIASMKVGEKALLIIDPDFGYGAQGAGRVIPPNATLMFEVELLGIK
ncbi:MAG: FKBP-type peptidyl-prolyl cis-trans isomerase [Candidatus Dependentiae bacterium]|nr:FKBP-type peptidyl-prolyl cis-trans isomerase [Candidatus Dependentiae bacterium]